MKSSSSFFISVVNHQCCTKKSRILRFLSRSLWSYSTNDHCPNVCCFLFSSFVFFFFSSSIFICARIRLWSLRFFFFFCLYSSVILPVYVYLKKEKTKFSFKLFNQYIDEICRYNMIVHLGFILLFSFVFVQGDQDEPAKTHIGECDHK